MTASSTKDKNLSMDQNWLIETDKKKQQTKNIIDNLINSFALSLT